jgi:hypothetical protein
MTKDEEITYTNKKIQRLLGEIHNKKREILLAMKKCADLQDCKVFVIPSVYDYVVFHDYIIAKSKKDAIDYGICVSCFDEIHEIKGDGNILYDDTFEMNFND